MRRILLVTILFAACSQQPPSWQQLVATRVRDQFPAYQVDLAPGGNLTVHRPELADAPVDVDAIARFCQRGPKDCEYAIGQALQDLQPAASSR